MSQDPKVTRLLYLDGPESGQAYGPDALPGESVREYRERKEREQEQQKAKEAKEQ